MAGAARLGHIEACDILAWSYYKPTESGVEPDYARAESLLLKTLDSPKRGRYPKLFARNSPRFMRIFREAQIRSGRQNPELAAALYEWLYDNVDKYPVSFSKLNIVNTFFGSLGMRVNVAGPKSSSIKLLRSMFNHLVTSRSSKAQVYDLLQFHESADEFPRANSEDDFSRAYAGRSRLTSQVALEKNKIRMGGVDPKAIDRLTTLIGAISKHTYLRRSSRMEAQSVLILALFQLGQTAKAWEMLKARREEVPFFLPFNLLWVEQKLAEGKLAGLEEILVSQLEWVRNQGEKVSEYELHLLYARFLKASGRLDEAIQVQLEAIRLIEGFDLSTLLPAAHFDIADLYALAGNLRQAKSSRAGAERLLNGGRTLPGHLIQSQAASSKSIDLKIVADSPCPRQSRGAKAFCAARPAPSTIRENSCRSLIGIFRVENLDDRSSCAISW